MTQPHELTLAQAAGEIAARRLSAVELTESLIARSADLEPRVLAWATLLPEQALAHAQAFDAARPAATRGPIAGVPYGAKDIFDTAGVRTAAGSRIWADRVPNADAAPIALARAAGAILLGKLHTTEFADGDPAPTYNPWSAEHTPGGSSAGSGAAVAARMIPWAFGSQTVGSVLRPAAYNGVVGLKPTFGRVPRLGVTPMASSFDHVGFLTADVGLGVRVGVAVGAGGTACVAVGVDVSVGTAIGVGSELQATRAKSATATMTRGGTRMRSIRRV